MLVLGGALGVLGEVPTDGTPGSVGVEGVDGSALPISWISVPGSGTWLAGMLAGTSTVTLMIWPVASRTSKVRLTAEAGRVAKTKAPAINATPSSAKRSLFVVILGSSLLPKGPTRSHPWAGPSYQRPAPEPERY